MNDVLCGSIWLILVRAFWEYFMSIAIAKVGKFADSTHRATKCYIVKCRGLTHSHGQVCDVCREAARHRQGCTSPSCNGCLNG